MPGLSLAIFFYHINKVMFVIMNSYKQLNIVSDKQFAVQLQVAKAMFNRFLGLQSVLGDAFLKSSKDFIN